MRDVCYPLLCGCRSTTATANVLCLFWDSMPSASSALVEGGHFYLHATKEETKAQKSHGSTANKLQA